MSFGRVVSLVVQSGLNEGTDLTGLRIRFNIVKTIEDAPNQAEIEIYNVSQETADKIAVADNMVYLKAGYEDEGGAKTIFVGNIVKGYYYHEGTETRLELTCLDGQKEMRFIPIALSYARGTSVATVYTDILAEIPLAVARQTGIPSLDYPSGYSFAGNAFDALDEVLRRVGLFYSVQNGQLYIMADEETIESVAFSITPKTGMLESPVPVVETNTATAEPVEKKKYRVRCLLNPLLLPNSYVYLESRVTEGYFKAQTVKQKGDSWQGDFESEVEVIAL